MISVSGPDSQDVRDQAVRIEYSPGVIQQIRRSAADGLAALPRVGMGVGGLLLGEVSGNGSLKLGDSVEIPCSHAGGPSFTLTPEEKKRTKELIRGITPLTVVGWYCSKPRGNGTPSEADFALYRELFPEPWQIMLLVRPSFVGPAHASLYHRNPAGEVVATEERELDDFETAEQPEAIAAEEADLDAFAPAANGIPHPPAYAGTLEITEEPEPAVLEERSFEPELPEIAELTPAEAQAAPAESAAEQEEEQPIAEAAADADQTPETNIPPIDWPKPVNFEDDPLEFLTKLLIKPEEAKKGAPPEPPGPPAIPPKPPKWIPVEPEPVETEEPAASAEAVETQPSSGHESVEPAAAPTPAQDGDEFAWLRNSLLHAPTPPPQQTNRRAWLIGAAAVATGGLAWLTRNSWLPRPPLALTINDSNGTLRIGWNPEALRGIDVASMSINDGGDLRTFTLTRDQLQSGSMKYTRTSPNVTATLDTGDARVSFRWGESARSAP